MNYLPILLFVTFLLAGCATDNGGLVTADLDREVINQRTFDQRIILSATDTLVENYHIVTLSPGRQVNVSTHAADVEADGQAFRIAVVRPLNNYYPHNSEPLPGNFLLLTPVGQDTSAFAVGQSNFGLIRDRTYFQINRKYYRLLEVADDYRSIRFERTNRKPAGPVTASLITRFRRFPVLSLDGTDQEVDLTPGRELMVFFWLQSPPVDSSNLVYTFNSDLPPPRLSGLTPEITDSLMSEWRRTRFYPVPAPPRPGDGPALLRLDSLYRQLRPDLDLVTIALDTSSAQVRQFTAAHPLHVPVYRADEGTCRFLNCNSQLPYALHVSAAGEILSYYLSPAAIERQLRNRPPAE